MYDAFAITVRTVHAMGEELNRIWLRAHAKLNLALTVGPPIDEPGSRTHGFHPICSYMHAIGLFDEIEMRRSETTSYDIRWVTPVGETRDVEWDIEDDLIARIHRVLSDRVGQELPCAIRVRKSIPAGGGLGGGSSDAASVLIGLNQIFSLKLEQPALVDMAMSIGSDIAYFIDPGFTPPRPALVAGFGEQIERVETRHRGQELTLIFPDFGCPTGSVYHAFDSIVDWESPDRERVRLVVDAEDLGDNLIVNDLYPAACAVQAALGPLQKRLADAVGAGVHLSGSGSTLYVLGRVDEGLLQEVVPECRVVYTRLC